jgi:regulator of sigma E protease
MNILISIFAIGLLIALHELGHMWAARAMGMKVQRYSIGLLHAIASWTSKRSGTVYQFGVLPLGGFVEIKGMNPEEEGALSDSDSYMMKSAWRRFVVLVSGPFANLLVGYFLIVGLYVAGLEEPTAQPRIGFVSEGGPAQQAGLKPQDTVLSIDGESVETWQELASGMHQRPGRPCELVVRRGQETLRIGVTPEDKGGVGLIGIGPATDLVQLPLLDAIVAAGGRSAQLTVGTLMGLIQLVSGKAKGVETSGIVGIVDMARTSLDLGVGRFLDFVAYLSLVLFLFNLLPVPALDGGRGVFLLFEMISRRRVPPKVDLWVNTVGFFLLIALMLVLTGKDIWKLLG